MVQFMHEYDPPRWYRNSIMQYDWFEIEIANMLTYERTYRDISYSIYKSSITFRKGTVP